MSLRGHHNRVSRCTVASHSGAVNLHWASEDKWWVYTLEESPVHHGGSTERQATIQSHTLEHFNVASLPHAHVAGLDWRCCWQHESLINCVLCTSPLNVVHFLAIEDLSFKTSHAHCFY